MSENTFVTSLRATGQKWDVNSDLREWRHAKERERDSPGLEGHGSGAAGRMPTVGLHWFGFCNACFLSFLNFNCVCVGGRGFM